MIFNTMRHLLFFVLCTIVSTSAFAQEEELPTPQDPKAKARIDAARAAYITDRLGLTTEEAEKFWPIYKEFAGRRQELRQQFVSAKREGKSDQELVDLGLKIKQQELDLEKEYSGRMMNVISAQKLMNLRMAEREFTRLILQQIQQRQQQGERRQQFREQQQDRLQRRNN
jgi:hypothetical protein